MSLTPDGFNAMQIMNSARYGAGKVEEYSPSIINALRDPLHRNFEDSSTDIRISGNCWESDDGTKSTCDLMLKQLDLTTNKKMKTIALNDMNLCCSTIPTYELCATPLGGVLQKLLLANNPLQAIPQELVVGLPALQILDLSNCQLHQLPLNFLLPSLRVMNLKNNKLTEFPNEVCISCHSLYFLAYKCSYITACV